jgi:hypothetical protein
MKVLASALWSIVALMSLFAGLIFVVGSSVPGADVGTAAIKVAVCIGVAVVTAVGVDRAIQTYEESKP